ncbi:MAG: 5-(carboxyamino)imidazole ribonucleotide mutase [Halieaceae bacterium]|jgi:phosphoribosylaminoimidazole carboxylase PurE protein|nr:5-(carboxyamino)imidazole ribonucleotide mutase [Halieaceae bacterium]
MSALVGIIMGSDSDLPTMSAAPLMLDKLGVSWELDIVSAHRTPERTEAYAREAAARGLRVIIAGAGGAAHLPGMIAASTPLPVIGVPVSATKMAGQDALYSIVQMPVGVPVATVAIDNATNAAILAAQMLATGDEALLQRIADYKAELREMVMRKSESLRSSSDD